MFQDFRHPVFRSLLNSVNIYKLRALKKSKIIFFQMMDENLQVASTISQELTSKVLVLSMNQVANFGQMYKNSVMDYKNKYFRDRTAVSK